MPTEQLRPVLVIALVLVVFLMWQAWQQDYGPKRDTARGPETAGAPAPTTPEVPAVSGQPAGHDVPALPEDAAEAAAPAPGEPAASRANSIRVETDTMRVEIDPRGGTLARLYLLDYPVSVAEPDNPYTLLNDVPPNLFLAQTGLLGERDPPNHHARFVADKTSYVLAEGEDELDVRLRWRGADGLEVAKIISFKRGSYDVGVEYRIDNRSPAAWTGRMYGQFQRMVDPATQKRGLGQVYTYTGGVLSSADKPYEKISFSDMEKENVDRTVTGGWLAMIQHYFIGAWIPDQRGKNQYYSKALPGGRFVLGLVTPAVVVPAGGTITLGLALYAGPKLQDRLAAAAPGLERTVDYGWLFFIAEPLYWALEYIHRIVGNWGWSIIILTILIKLAFFKLSATSYKSMARMRKLQPRMKALRERYGDDKAKLNQAMMEMYKKDKINPLGGCLPIVVQIPVFISLYWVLLETVELRQAPFMFWLKDLSTNDPYFVLPVVMGASMFLQQRLNPTPPDPIQAKLMMALPIVFTFFFLFFPAGLVLYWIVNNVLSIAQQWVITRRIAPGT